MADKDKLAYASTMSANDAARHIEALAQGLREHVMVIESGDTSIAIDVAREVRLELEAGASQKGSQLEIKIAWRAEEGTEIQPPVLKILPRDSFVLEPNGIGTGENGLEPSQKAKAPKANPVKPNRVKPRTTRSSVSASKTKRRRRA